MVIGALNIALDMARQKAARRPTEPNRSRMADCQNFPV